MNHEIFIDFHWMNHKDQTETVHYWAEKDDQRHSNCSEDSGMPESGSQSGLNQLTYK